MWGTGGFSLGFTLGSPSSTCDVNQPVTCKGNGQRPGALLGIRALHLRPLLHGVKYQQFFN